MDGNYCPEKKDIVKLGVIGVILAFVYISVMLGSGAGIVAFIGGILFGCIPFGWRLLSSIQPRMFLLLPIIGWIIYFFIKFFLSCLVGWIAMPLLVYRAFKNG